MKLGGSVLLVVSCAGATLILLSILSRQGFSGHETGGNNEPANWPQSYAAYSDEYLKLVKHIRQNVLVPPPAQSHRRTPKPNEYHSQMGQDKFVNDKVFKNRKHGTFIEAGALDGVQYSNSLFFEDTLGWTGLLVEPDPWMFQKLKAAKRNIWLLHGCLGSHRTKTQQLRLNTNNGEAGGKAIAFLEELGNQHKIWNSNVPNATKIAVTCYPLNLLLDAIGWRHVDYFSLDVEGAEAAVLHSIDYERHSFGLIDIECNSCVDATGKWLGQMGQDMLEKRHYIKKHLEFEGYNETYWVDQDIFYVPNSKS